jgi:outer membrane lipoprotein-sorting protein
MSARMGFAVVCLALGAGLAFVAGAAEGDLPKGEDVMAKVIDALGGKAAMEKHSSSIAKGTIAVETFGVTGTMTTYSAKPNKRYTAIDLNGQGVVERGVHGEVVWEVNPFLGSRVVSGEEGLRELREATFNGMLSWKDDYKSVECTGVETVGGQECYQLKMTPKAGALETMSVDKTTFLPVAVSYTITEGQAAGAVTVRMSDYKEFDGVKVPGKLTRELPTMIVALTIDSVEFNAEIPEDRFNLPAEIQSMMKAAADATAQSPATGTTSSVTSGSN